MDSSAHSVGGRTYITVVALVATFALSAATSASAAQRLSPAKILRIALRQSRADHERHPTGIILASGPLRRALAVMSPSATIPPPSPSREPHLTGPGGATGAKGLVDLVAAHGRFTSNGSHPRGIPAPKGRVLELVVDAYTGAIEAQALLPRVPVPLSHLGPVRPLG
jgi:hypothetical protein